MYMSEAGGERAERPPAGKSCFVFVLVPCVRARAVLHPWADRPPSDFIFFLSTSLFPLASGGLPFSLGGLFSEASAGLGGLFSLASGGSSLWPRRAGCLVRC